MGCASLGDFDRPRSSPFDNSWIAPIAAHVRDVPVSAFPFTDDEKTLRDLAFNIILPPYDRTRWDYAIVELCRIGVISNPGPAFDRTSYASRMYATAYRSATARYNRLVDDIHTDIESIGPFAAVARRVIDMDRKREKSLGYVSNPPKGEHAEAMLRIAENKAVVDWVKRALGERAIAYRYALERLVIATPSPMAAEADRLLGELQSRLTAGGVLTAALTPALDGPVSK